MSSEISRDIAGRLASRFLSNHQLAAARVLDGLPVEQTVAALAAETAALAASVMQQMDRSAAAACLARWPAEQRGDLLAALERRHAARLLRGLDIEERRALLEGCEKSISQPLERLLRYPEDTAGALMDPQVLALLVDLEVGQARERLSERSRGTEDYVYVVDREDILVGVLEVAELFRAPAEEPLAALVAQTPPAKISTRAERAAILAHAGWRHHHSSPVVDRRGALVGVIRYQTLREIEHVSAVEPRHAPLGLALAEMYWTTVSSAVESVVRSLGPRERSRPGEER